MPPPEKRVRSVGFSQGGIEYVARVGERRQGMKWYASPFEPPDTFEVGTTVVPIFEEIPPDPGYIWQEKEFAGSEWENPQLYATVEESNTSEPIDRIRRRTPPGPNQGPAPLRKTA